MYLQFVKSFWKRLSTFTLGWLYCYSHECNIMVILYSLVQTYNSSHQQKRMCLIKFQVHFFLRHFSNSGLVLVLLGKLSLYLTGTLKLSKISSVNVPLFCCFQANKHECGICQMRYCTHQNILEVHFLVAANNFGKHEILSLQTWSSSSLKSHLFLQLASSIISYEHLWLVNLTFSP